MGWRHSVPLALSALPIDRGGAQGAVGVNNRPKPKPAAPKGGTGPHRTFESLMNSNAEKTAEIRRLCASEFRLLQLVGLDGHSLGRYI